MKVAMINDCAHVGETLIKYFPKGIQATYVKRSRGLWDKTFGVGLKVMKTRADVYHVHYLLQDCYIASKLGKSPLIGHAHGSDLRSSLYHPLWGRVVKYNLRNCGKVLVSTPDILPIARRFREDAEYLPNPVDTKLFYPKPMAEHEKKRVLIGFDLNWDVKGADIVVRALSRIKEKVNVYVIAYGRDFWKTMALTNSLRLYLNVLPRVRHEDMRDYYWSMDVVVDRFRLGSLGMISLEAIASGRPVVVNVSSRYEEYKDFPLKDLSDEEEIAEAVLNADEGLWRKEYDYLVRHHSPEDVARRVLEIYKEMEEGHDELLGI